VATPREVLAANRDSALRLVQSAGTSRTRVLLEDSERELVQRLAGIPGGARTFTRVQMEATLAQVRHVLYGLKDGMEDVLVEGAETGSAHAAAGTVEYLERAEREFRGTGTKSLALDEVSMFEEARVGARASVLRRLASSGTDAPGASDAEHPARMGILDRYGVETIGHFENELQKGLLARLPWEDVKANLVSKSPFLQQKPGFWAERIVRTELMGAYNRAGWESIREADSQLGDMCKILSATFDERTAADSFAVHGQIRMPDEAFMSWFGLYQHPPNRPNDREIVVPHRISWKIPDYLKWKDDGEVAARWRAEKRKGKPPERPLMTTVDVGRFGADQPPPARDDGGAPREIPDDE